MTHHEDEPHDAAAVVVAAWGRTETWLRAHAPMSRATLRPSATPEQLAAAEQNTGHALPALLVGDEEAAEDLNTFLHGEGLLRINRATDLHAMMVSTGEWTGSWLPFTADNPDDPYAGSFLDTGTGKVGRWGLMDVPSPGQETLAEYLSRAADALDRSA
ncbi:hypothetical protein [Streptomyces sp. NPDC053720]|uniref:hypothetical protein n=1 Tax=Streptomyces sp. NPDC053720 TaxID=3154855 RepID=UPI00343D9B67